MPQDIKTGSVYNTQVPSLTDIADIIVALTNYHYGITSGTAPVDGSVNSQQGIAGWFKYLETNKANLANPTFTGTVTLPTQSSSAAPLRFVSGTLKSSTQTGAMEYDGTKLYLTNNSSTRKTVAYIGDAGYTLLYSGSISYSASATTTTAYITSGRDFSDYKSIVIIFQSGANNSGSGNFTLRFNAVATGYKYSYSNYVTGTATLASTTAGTGFNIINGSSGFGTAQQVIVEIKNPGSNVFSKNASWQNVSGFGFGHASNVTASITDIGYITTSNTPALDWYIYGIK